MHDYSLSPIGKLILRILATHTKPILLEELFEHFVGSLSSTQYDLEQIRSTLRDNTLALSEDELLKLAKAHPDTGVRGTWISLTDAGRTWTRLNT